MSNFKLDKYHKDLMKQIFASAIIEVENDLVFSMKQMSGKDRTVQLHQLDVLQKVADKLDAKLS